MHLKKSFYLFKWHVSYQRLPVTWLTIAVLTVISAIKELTYTVIGKCYRWLKLIDMLNLTQIINEDKTMKILKKSIHASDTDQLLSSSGPFTFFAPTDVAFEKLGNGLMDNLLEPQSRSKLANLLKNHVVTGKVNYSELKDGDTLTTVNGKSLHVAVKNGQVSIDNTPVHPREIKIINGVLHSVDKVFQ
jgi:uncharacterized surface protein with fasciclin (FAS1) repeats